MSPRNSIIVISLILGSLVVLGLVVDLRDAGLGDGSFDKGQRFTAKPGTTRENAMLLTSNKRAETAVPDPSSSSGAEEDSDPLEVKSLSKPASDSDPNREGPAGETARAALNNLSPEEGLRQLDAALALPSTPAQAALLHEAAGQLHAQTSPPDFAKSLSSFEQAAALAEDQSIKDDIAYKTAQTLMQAGREGEALEDVEAYLAENPPKSATGYKLLIIHGQLLERAGQIERAEDLYQQVLDAARDIDTTLAKDDALSLARLSGLRLTQLYRSHDRAQAADALSKSLKRELSRLEEL